MSYIFGLYLIFYFIVQMIVHLLKCYLKILHIQNCTFLTGINHSSTEQTRNRDRDLRRNVHDVGNVFTLF